MDDFSFNNYSIRCFLWVFYGTVFLWLVSPDLVAWLFSLKTDSFRDAVVLGIGIGIVVTIVEIIRGGRQVAHDLSVSSLFCIVFGLALLGLAYLGCCRHGISLDALPPYRTGPPIGSVCVIGAGSITVGVISMAISRFLKKPS